MFEALPWKIGLWTFCGIATAEKPKSGRLAGGQPLKFTLFSGLENRVHRTEFKRFSRKSRNPRQCRRGIQQQSKADHRECLWISDIQSH